MWLKTSRRPKEPVASTLPGSAPQPPPQPQPTQLPQQMPTNAPAVPQPQLTQSQFPTQVLQGPMYPPVHAYPPFLPQPPYAADMLVPSNAVGLLGPFPGYAAP